ncbi:MAG: UPF0489 family protein [Ignavibacteria bacterium]|nr:UPF0489 family protein [Ignavibacteria bacterium]
MGSDIDNILDLTKGHYEYRNQSTEPPGTYYNIAGDPLGSNEISLEVAVLNEHRFAFYYWIKWTNKLKKSKGFICPPNLVSIDWHLDLGDPEDTDLLRDVDQNNLQQVSFFSWGLLNPLNDTHIKSAMYLNAIKDVYLLRKQTDFDDDDKTFLDIDGNTHNIFLYKRIDTLEEDLKKINSPFYFDIDLDYFLNSTDFCGDDGQIMTKDEIDKILDPERSLYESIYKSIKGFTIAREPKWCNGLLNSNFIMDTLNENLFKGTLLKKDLIWNYKNK